MRAVRFHASDLTFHPMMTLQAAARIAHQNGYELRVRWYGNQCIVTPVKFESDDDIPALLRLQAD